MKKILSVLLTVMMSFGLFGCSTENIESDKLQVYTSFYAMYDFTKMIAGDSADIHLMCPPGNEPHDYEPSAADMAKLADGDLFVYNGGGMEHWTEKISSVLNNVTAVCTSDGLIDVQANDPHIWLDPDIALVQMRKICDALTEADPVNKDTYEKNYKNCTAMTEELKTAYEQTLSGTRLKTIVVGHGAYGYLCKAYGIEQISVEGTAGDSDPSPADMARVVEKAKELNIKYICSQEMESSKVVESAAKEIGAEIAQLNPFEGSADSKGYFEVMYENLETLKKVLE